MYLTDLTENHGLYVRTVGEYMTVKPFLRGGSDEGCNFSDFIYAVPIKDRNGRMTIGLQNEPYNLKTGIRLELVSFKNLEFL